MYSISEVQHLLGLSASTLRYYEKEGLIPDIKRTEGGKRIYTEDQIGWLRFIIALKETGMTIDKIKAYLDMNVRGEETLAERREFLAQHKARIENNLAQTLLHLERINQKISYYDAVVLGKSFF
ncbi:MerR family transcriptional regulator [Paenibacillus algorifonticola]|uniref:MerR family transcriptional regulator n=1 Tax=Paenibacillus algorifonticola TaxID=684063 RepID=UPI003D2B0291